MSGYWQVRTYITQEQYQYSVTIDGQQVEKTGHRQVTHEDREWVDTPDDAPVQPDVYEPPELVEAPPVFATMVDENLFSDDWVDADADGIIDAGEATEILPGTGRASSSPSFSDDRLALEAQYTTLVAQGRIPPFLQVEDETTARTDQLQTAVLYGTNNWATAPQPETFSYAPYTEQSALVLPTYGSTSPNYSPGAPAHVGTIDGSNGPIRIASSGYGVLGFNPADPLADFNYTIPVSLDHQQATLTVENISVIEQDMGDGTINQYFAVPYEVEVDGSTQSQDMLHSRVYDQRTGAVRSEEYPLATDRYPDVDLGFEPGTRVRVDYAEDGSVASVTLRDASGEEIPAAIVHDEAGNILYVRDPETQQVIRPDASLSATEMQIYGQLGTDGADALTQAAEAAGFAPTDEGLAQFMGTSEGAQLYLELADQHGAAMVEQQLANAGLDANDPGAALISEQLGSSHVDTALQTVMNETAGPERLAQVQAEAESVVQTELGLRAGDEGYEAALAGVAQGILMSEIAPVLDGYAAYYSADAQADYEAHLAAGGTLEDFIARRTMTQGLSPSSTPMEMEILRTIAIANDPTLASMPTETIEGFLSYDWAAYQAVQSGAQRPEGYVPPSAEMIGAFEAVGRVNTSINAGVIQGWQEQHQRFMDQWSGMIDQVDAETGAIAEGLVYAYESYNLLHMTPLAIPSLLFGGSVTLESIFGEATSQAEAEAALAEFDRLMQDFFRGQDPSQMSALDLAVAELQFGDLVRNQTSTMGEVGEAYARTMGYANIGDEIVKTVGVVAATMLTFTGVGTGPGVAFLLAVGAGTGTRVALDAFDSVAGGGTYDLEDLQGSIKLGAFDSSLSVISYLAAARAFQAVSIAGRAGGLTAGQAAMAGHLAGFGAETAVDSVATIGLGLATGQDLDAIMFDLALGIGLNIGFSTIGGFDYDQRIVNRTMITDGPNAGSWEFTLADSTTRVVPSWMGNMVSLSPPGAPSNQAWAGMLSTLSRWIDGADSPVAAVRASLQDPTSSQVFVVVGQGGEPESWRLVEVTQDESFDLSGLELSEGEQVLGSVSGPMADTSLLQESLTSSFGVGVSPTYFDFYYGANGLQVHTPPVLEAQENKFLLNLFNRKLSPGHWGQWDVDLRTRVANNVVRDVGADRINALGTRADLVQGVRTLQDIENSIAATQGRAPVTVVIVQDMRGDGGYMASYDGRYNDLGNRTVDGNNIADLEGQPVILIPANRVGDGNVLALIDTMLHESRHAFQRAAQNGNVTIPNAPDGSPDGLANFAEQMANTPAATTRDYATNLRERDARTFAQQGSAVIASLLN